MWMVLSLASGSMGTAASGWGNDDWKATVDLTLDPGEQLRQVASEVRARDRRHAVVTSDLDDVARIDPMLQLIYV